MAKKDEAVPVIEETHRPATTVDATGSVTSEQQESEALREVGYIDARKASLSARLDEQTAQLREAFKEAHFLTVEDKRMSFDERRAALMKGLEKFGFKHRKDLQTGDDKKSIRLTFGDVGFRSIAKHVDFVEGKCEDDVLATIERISSDGNKENGVMQRLRSLFGSLRLFPSSKESNDSRCVDLVCDVDVAFSKTKALAAYNEKKITAAELKRLGITIVKAENKYFAKPSAFAPDKVA